MPVIDDDFDDQAPAPQPSQPGAAQPVKRAGRMNPLIPVMSLRKWVPDQDEIDRMFGHGRPKVTQGGANAAGEQGRNT